MKKFKNVFLLAAMAVSAVCVTSCGEDDDDNNGGGSLSITAVVEDGNDYNDKIDEVKVLVSYVSEAKTETFATVKYADGGFTLVLPAVPDDKYLRPIKDVINYYGSGIKVGDDTAKGLAIRDFEAYKSGQKIGYFSYEPEFVYVDKDVTITSSMLDGVSLKKGWNILYPKGSGSDLNGYTTTPPSTPYKWSVHLY